MRLEDPITAFEELIDSPKDPYKRILWVQEYLQAADKIEREDKIKHNLVQVAWLVGLLIAYKGIIFVEIDVLGLSMPSGIIYFSLFSVSMLGIGLLYWINDKYERRLRRLNGEREHYADILRCAEREIKDIIGKHSKDLDR